MAEPYGAFTICIDVPPAMSRFLLGAVGSGPNSSVDGGREARVQSFHPVTSRLNEATMSQIAVADAV